MGLKDIGETLPPGFRFYPSDEELVCHYLQKKIANEEVLKGTLVEVDLHACEPWQLPDAAKLNTNEWYFFNFRDRKYATGFRTNRATSSGYWKATGKDRVILDPKTARAIGMRKTLVFYKNRAPNGMKTSWIMHEFRLESPHMPPKEDWVLCRVLHKSRGETTTNENIPPRVFDQIIGGASSPNSAVPPPTEHHVMSCGHQRVNSFPSNPSTQNLLINQNHNALDLGLLNPNFLQLLKEEGNYVLPCSELFIPKNDHHEYGNYPWDMNLVDDRLDDGAPDHDFTDMGFEDDDGVVLS
ncbi:hypothetical protein Nepgr_004176 [Nepenthes gracilis]|uniref:NAC domain-containing protein n=1 Tax=Nepenthes gracilis TaxID=150966 RepID=A0AAD3XEU3_NEPGR|nr:hypothetical protein Nepgr_004176 [Nepenthes gracilis]